MLTIEMSQPYFNSALRRVTLVLIYCVQVNTGISSDKYLGLSDKPQNDVWREENSTILTCLEYMVFPKPVEIVCNKNSMSATGQRNHRNNQGGLLPITEGREMSWKSASFDQ